MRDSPAYMLYNNMRTIYQNIIRATTGQSRLLALLIDPDKADLETLDTLFAKINASKVTHIFIGGSTDEKEKTTRVVARSKALTKLPIVLFPGDYKQISGAADAILFLSLISGRNPEYLIEQQIKSVPRLKNEDLEIIPTGYILIDGNTPTSVQQISKTAPIAQDNIELIINTALAGQYSGKQLIYLEAGSGAVTPVSTSIIKNVKQTLKIPLIVGGGIRTIEQLEKAYLSGADMVVIGTAFEENQEFLNELKK